MRYYTIGMAGHIDHGKTSLTKALSNVDTDTLKEEKERKITIEPGFAPFPLTEDIHTSIVDVPGHEKFIRQMIAGVAGIDLVLLVIAADEGVMPQTREHFEILSFLGIERGLVVVTKIDNVQKDMFELLKEDIHDLIGGTPFEAFPIHFVDSLSMKGIDSLKSSILNQLETVAQKKRSGPFRMPIDHVFTVKGQGTVVRGTIFEGSVGQGDRLVLEPKGSEVKVRQLQVHRQYQTKGVAGQRAALNLSGVSHEEIKRGDVLISAHSFITSDTIDIRLKTVKNVKPLKQRAPIKFYIGTAEMIGKIVFFDRNELLEDNEAVFCQVRLHSPVVAKRGDRFIIRRPSPEETIGGGEVIEPAGEKYRFGYETINRLKAKWEGSPEDRIEDMLKKHKLLTLKELEQSTSLQGNELVNTLKTMQDEAMIDKIDNSYYTLLVSIADCKKCTCERILSYHKEHPLKIWMPKAELIQELKEEYPERLIKHCLHQLLKQDEISMSDQYVKETAFHPSFPKKWEKRMNSVVNELYTQGLQADSFTNLYKKAQLPQELFTDFKHFLIREKLAVPLEEDLFLHIEVFEKAVFQLKKEFPGEFTIQEAKSVLNLSRKYLIPFLELLDYKGITERVDMKRHWVMKTGDE